MSSRRNGDVSRAAETASKNRLHMDRNPQHLKINDPAHPAGRRKELDNVMKRARQGSPGTWDRKLLEMEEKDPNRWRHTGYKAMYLGGSRSPSSRRSRSPAGPPRRSRSPIPRKNRTPPPRRSRSPLHHRSPINRRSPIARRSPIPRRSPLPRRSRSPVLRRSNDRGGRRSPRRSPIRKPLSPVRRPRSPPPRRARPPEPAHPPPHRDSSESGSSSGTCSDDSCSVCTPKNKRQPPPPKPPPPKLAKKPPSPNAPPPGRAGLVPTRELLKAREATKRSREEKVLEWQRSQLAAAHVSASRAAPPAGPVAAAPPAPGAAPTLIPPARIKREESPRHSPRTDKRPRRRDRGVSPSAIAAALNDSSGESEPGEDRPARLTLSERFGKMAQWSQDRSSRVENMRITRKQSARGFTVSIEPQQSDLEPAPEGSYPEELLAVAPGGMPSWDDVTVRYDYYKERGYLRGLTLGDYVKWEEWWYKYQEWLKRERAYERWAENDLHTGRRERRRRGGRHRRS